jgi:hypothetical protein
MVVVTMLQGPVDLPVSSRVMQHPDVAPMKGIAVRLEGLAKHQPMRRRVPCTPMLALLKDIGQRSSAA